jgi:hypothetical protein
MRWYTELEIINVETAEIINRNKYKKNDYYIIKKEIKIKVKTDENNEKYGIRELKWIVKENRQTNLWECR